MCKTAEMGGPSKTAALLRKDKFERLCDLVTSDDVPAAARAPLGTSLSFARGARLRCHFSLSV